MTKSNCCQQFQHSRAQFIYYLLASFLHGHSQRFFPKLFSFAQSSLDSKTSLFRGFSWAKRPHFCMLLFPVLQRGIQGGKWPQSTPVRGPLKGLIKDFPKAFSFKIVRDERRIYSSNSQSVSVSRTRPESTGQSQKFEILRIISVLNDHFDPNHGNSVSVLLFKEFLPLQTNSVLHGISSATF